MESIIELAMDLFIIIVAYSWGFYDGGHLSK